MAVRASQIDAVLGENGLVDVRLMDIDGDVFAIASLSPQTACVIATAMAQAALAIRSGAAPTKPEIVH
jgi:hypothetical protein